MRRWSGVFSAFAWLTAFGTARADGADPAQAQFDQGLSDMEAGRFETGCPKLAESYRLDPQPGVLFTLAECEAKWGKLATAVTHYRGYVDLLARMTPGQRAKQQHRERVAHAQIEALYPRLPELAIVAPPSAREDFTIERDGIALEGASLGVSSPLDPGEHKVRLRLADGRDRSYVVTLSEGERRRLQLELPAGPASAERREAQPDREAIPSSTSSSASPWPWVLLATGGVGVALGAVTGTIAIGSASTAHAHCVDRICDAEGKNAADRASTLGWISTGAFGAGVVLAAAGGWLLLSKPRANGRVSYIAPRPLGIELGMTF